MTLDSELLRAFVSVILHSSFTRAANSLNPTQSTVSHQVCRLAEGLDTQLIRRTSRPICLTADGKEVLMLARQILRLHDQITARRFNKMTSRCRIGLNECVPTELVAEILRQAALCIPKVDLSFELSTSECLRDGVNSGNLDLALVATISVEADVSSVLSREPLVWLAAKRWRAPSAGPLPLILRASPCTNRQAAIKSLQQNSVAWFEVLTVNTHQTMLDAVCSGMGVGVATTSHAGNALRCLSDGDGFPSLPNVSFELIPHPNKPKNVDNLSKTIAASWSDHLRMKDTSRTPCSDGLLALC
jgi:DNA-binding transcriptional LysR family regulator